MKRRLRNTVLAALIALAATIAVYAAAPYTNQWDWISGGGGDIGASNLWVGVYAGVQTYGTTTGGEFTLGAWNHYAMVFDGSQSGNTNRLKFYKNGGLVPLTFTGTISSRLPEGNGCMTLGMDYGGNIYYTGSMDDVLLFRGNGSQYSMTQTQVTNIFLKSKANYNL